MPRVEAFKTKVMNFLGKIEAVPPELFTVKHPSSLNHSLPLPMMSMVKREII